MIDLHCKEMDAVWFGVAVEGKRIVATSFSPSEEGVLRSLLEDLPYDKPFQVVEEPSHLSTKVAETMKAIFDGRDVLAKFSLDMNHLSGYTHKVLGCVSLIPVGYTTTYGAIAKVVGGPPRSVGQALASNPFPLLIPCHRVIRADFGIGGFSGYGGVETKRELLRKEDRGYGKEVKIEVSGKILALYPTKYLREINS